MTLQQKLRKIYQEADGGKDLFDWLATYKNRKTETAADRASALSGVSYPKTIALFRELDEIEVGTFKNGRRDYKTRIIWHYSPRDLAKIAAGGNMELVPYDDDSELEDADTDAAEPASSTGLSFLETVERARTGLASSLGISPDKIEIVIKP